MNENNSENNYDNSSELSHSNNTPNDIGNENVGTVSGDSKTAETSNVEMSPAESLSEAVTPATNSLTPEHSIIHLSTEEKMQLLTGYLKKNSQKTHILIYANSAYLAQKTAVWLNNLGLEAINIALNTETEVSAEAKAQEEKWLSGEIKIAVGTDMSYKLWPENSANLIIQFELPKYHHHYQDRLQKLNNKTPTESIGFCAFEDCEYLLNIEHALKHKIPVQDLAEKLLEKNLGEEPQLDEMPNRMDYSKIAAKGLKASARDSWHRKDQDSGIADKWDKMKDREPKRSHDSHKRGHDNKFPETARNVRPHDSRSTSESFSGKPAEHKPKFDHRNRETIRRKPFDKKNDRSDSREADFSAGSNSDGQRNEGSPNPFRVDRFTDPDYLRYLESKGKKLPERKTVITPVSANKNSKSAEKGSDPADKSGSLFNKVKKWIGFSCLIISLGFHNAAALAESPEAVGYQIYDTAQQKVVSLADLVASRPLFFVGEQHDQIYHHMFKTALLNESLSQGKQLVVVLEYLPQDYDAQLTQYNQGLLGTFQHFVNSINWDKVWGYSSKLQPFFDFLSSHPQIKVIASDLNRDINRKIAHQGYASLSSQEQEKIGPIFLDQALYRKWYDSISPHPVPEPTATHYFESFIARNTVMAKRIIEVNKSVSPNTQIFYFAGNGHLEYGLGVPTEVKHFGDNSVDLAHHVLYLDSELNLPNKDDEIFKADPKFGLIGDMVVNFSPLDLKND